MTGQNQTKRYDDLNFFKVVFLVTPNGSLNTSFHPLKAISKKQLGQTVTNGLVSGGPYFCGEA